MISLTVLLILGWIISYFRIKKLSGEGKKFSILRSKVPEIQGLIFIILSIILGLILLPTIIYLIITYIYLIIKYLP